MTRHKTFRTYTTRQKQGGSQSSRDNQSGSNIRSAGASLRRRNEASLQMVRKMTCVVFLRCRPNRSFSELCHARGGLEESALEICMCVGEPSVFSYLKLSTFLFPAFNWFSFRLAAFRPELLVFVFFALILGF